MQSSSFTRLLFTAISAIAISCGQSFAQENSTDVRREAVVQQSDAGKSDRVRLFEIWVGVALLGIWSCIGVIYKNSGKQVKQNDEIIRLLGVCLRLPLSAFDCFVIAAGCVWVRFLEWIQAALARNAFRRLWVRQISFHSPCICFKPLNKN